MSDSTMRVLAGSGGGTVVVGEVPSGSINGSNVTFTLANTPNAGTLAVYLNGARQKSTDDYSLSGVTITFVSAPISGSNLLADYEH